MFGQFSARRTYLSSRFRLRSGNFGFKHMRWLLQSTIGRKDGAQHRAGNGYLGQLEGDGAGVTDDADPCLDQLEQQAGQRPVSHRFRQVDATQEGSQIVGQRVQLQPDLVIAEPLA